MSNNVVETGAERDINPLELLQVLVRRKSLILKICAAALVVSAAVSFFLPDVYSSTAKVLPPQRDGGGGLSAVLSQMGGLAGLAAGGLGGGGNTDLYLGILKSRSVEDAVIQRLDLTNVYGAKDIEGARRKLEKVVKAQAGKDGIIVVTTEDEDPKLAAQLANTLVDELGKTTVRLNLTKAGTERVFLEKRLDVVKKDLKNAEEELKSFAQRTKMILIDSQARASIEGVARLKAELARQEVLLAVATSNQTDESPQVQAIRSAIRRIKSELGAQAGNGGGGEGIPSVGSVPSVGLEYSRRLREFKTQEAIFEQLTKQYEVAKLNEAKDSSSMQVLDQAVVPLHKSKPKRSLIVVLSTLTAFFCSVLVIFMQEYLKQFSASDRQLIENIKKYAISFK